MQNILTMPTAETLAKSKMWYLAPMIKDDKSISNKALMLCLRYKIVINKKQYHDFVDTISLCEQANIDWHKREVLSDLKTYHDKALKILSKRQSDEEKKKLQAYEQEFRTHHRSLIGIAFSSSDLSFSSLNSVLEYYEEGKAMHHCVYQAKYYLRPEALIMSVRDSDNQRLATIEYDVNKKEVIQCRAACNTMPERYDQILNGFYENIGKFL